MCDTKEENITHFLECSKYGKKKIEIKDVYTQNTENQFFIAERVEERMIERKNPAYGKQSISRPMRIVAPTP